MNKTRFNFGFFTSQVLLGGVIEFGESACALQLQYGPHAVRATAATNALSHEADIASVQEWLGHVTISTTRIYDRRAAKPEESPTFRVTY